MKMSKNEKQLRHELKTFEDLFGVEIVNFEYCYKAFGNCMFDLICDNETFNFVTDRGSVVINHEMEADASTHEELLQEMTLICAKKRSKENKTTHEQCVKMLGSDNYLMRAYGSFFFPLADNTPVKEQIDILENALRREQDLWTVMYLVRQLLVLGQKKYFTFFVSAINDPFAKIRCTMLRIIPDVIECLSEEESHILQLFLEEREKIEGDIFGSAGLFNLIIRTLKRYFVYDPSK